ncbi:MAG: ABC transporter permease [Cyanobacteria bacterium CAN_BIN43]|jgi:ABC-2 type transport system permease protein|nr:ABC transporter permease [Cyanobacteria bacterium CAN_BIN43]
MLDLFFAELKRSWIILSRYATETIGGIIATTFVFYGLFLSSRYIAGPGIALGDRLDSVIVGYILWTLMLFIMGDVAGGLQDEARTGTLEQMFLTPYGAARVFVIRAIGSLSIQLTLNVVIVVAIILITGSKLEFPLILVPPFITALLGAYGLAFTVGSLTLVFKQVRQVQSVLQFGLLLLLAAPTETWTGSLRLVGWLMPIAPGAGLLRDVMARGLELDAMRMAIASVNGLFYFTMGVLLFGWAERLTKRQGRLGGY